MKNLKIRLRITGFVFHRAIFSVWGLNSATRLFVASSVVPASWCVERTLHVPTCSLPARRETLADRVWSQSGHTREEILNTLTFAESSGSLKLGQKDQRVKWEWVDYL